MMNSKYNFQMTVILVLTQILFLFYFDFAFLISMQFQQLHMKQRPSLQRIQEFKGQILRLKKNINLCHGSKAILKKKLKIAKQEKDNLCRLLPNVLRFIRSQIENLRKTKIGKRYTLDKF